MSVQEYLDKYMLSRRIEDAVNAAVRAKTPDPVLFISNHMRKAIPSVITKIKARQILDSRGIPTVEVDLYTNKGMFRASAPSGDGTGMYCSFPFMSAVITERYGASGCNVGEVGGLTPNILSVREGLDLVKEAISRTGFNDRIKIAIDVAATEFCIGTKYDLEFKSPSRSGQNFKSGEDMIQMYKELCSDYPIVLIEDPFDKEDWEHNKVFCALGLCQVLGDDLLNSNLKRIEKAIQESACNSLILKINQIGTVTEAIEVVKLAKDAHWGVVASHRWGETEDSFIADLAVGLGASQIKAGAPCRGERLAKYNQLLRIEEELGDQAIYAGEDWRPSS
ncbi:hypothetical protein SLEP1_g57977 [Rubroshorea leprosula]|uniref:phosphopyruvate hydratase n=1 Tax=Rubroshorea leprosula TaxID=152421 RepID=A0AAV5MMU4_9ROSI|nr:hypothetical protein SLEP1_g57977 [Rubroshorea leprosula]